METYPVNLPLPLRTGYKLETENNIIRTPLQSGRARQRTAFTFVPSYADVSWILTATQAVDFESFTVIVGADWFNLTLKTPNGDESRVVRFMQSPTGPVLMGINLWQYAAKLELRDRATTITSSSL